MNARSRDFVKNLSDHQILEMIDVLLADDHSPMDPARDTYLAAYAEAKDRPVVWDVVCARYPNLVG